METQVMIPVGNHRIYGMLHVPEHLSDRKLPVVVICHGFISNKVGQHRIFVKTAREISQHGFAVLRFDYTGCGESTGEYENITFDRQVDETSIVLDFLATLPYIDSGHIIMLGHSFGGSIASYVAERHKIVRKLILWSPVANPLADIIGIVGKELYQECMEGKQVHYQGFELGREFFVSLTGLLPLEKIKGFNGDVLIVHGTEDYETPLLNAHLYEHAVGKRPVGEYEMKIIGGADHTYSSPLSEKEVIAITLQWLKCSTM